MRHKLHLLWVAKLPSDEKLCELTIKLQEFNSENVFRLSSLCFVIQVIRNVVLSISLVCSVI